MYLFLLFAIWLSPLIIIIVFNGVRGKGYQMRVKTPSIDTAEGVIVRAAYLVWVIVFLALYILNH